MDSQQWTRAAPIEKSRLAPAWHWSSGELGQAPNFWDNSEPRQTAVQQHPPQTRSPLSPPRAHIHFLPTGAFSYNIVGPSDSATHHVSHRSLARPSPVPERRVTADLALRQRPIANTIQVAALHPLPPTSEPCAVKAAHNPDSPARSLLHRQPRPCG
jgi:hypothetical protein